MVRKVIGHDGMIQRNAVHFLEEGAMKPAGDELPIVYGYMLDTKMGTARDYQIADNGEITMEMDLPEEYSYLATNLFEWGYYLANAEFDYDEDNGITYIKSGELRAVSAYAIAANPGAVINVPDSSDIN